MGKFSKHFLRQSSTGSPVQDDASKEEEPEQQPISDIVPPTKSEESNILQSSTSANMDSSYEKDQDKYKKNNSRIDDLLSSFKEDVIKVRDEESSSGPMVSRSSSSYPFQPDDYHRQFTRVSPQKLAATVGSSSQSSKWKKAVRLSKTVMARPKAALSRASKNFPSVLDSGSNDGSTHDNPEDKLKMSFLFKIINHSSCIASGILAGLLLWSSIDTISHHNLIRSEASLLFYYTITVLLMYVCLLEYIMRLYTWWTRLSPSILLHALVILFTLVLHYLHKSYDLLLLECHTEESSDGRSVQEEYGFCNSVNQNRKSSSSVYALLVLSKLTQTFSVMFLSVYFHFTPYSALGPIILTSRSSPPPLRSPRV